MRKIPKKVIVSATPATIDIDLDSMPKHELDTLCRVVLRLTEQTFKQPGVQAEYELWLEQRKAKGGSNHDTETK